MCLRFSADNGRVKITTSGVFCAVSITNALPKDDGDWKLTIGAGEQLMDFEKNTFVYSVSVKGKIKTIYIAYSNSRTITQISSIIYFLLPD